MWELGFGSFAPGVDLKGRIDSRHWDSFGLTWRQIQLTLRRIAEVMAKVSPLAEDRTP
jgi:hypothetical protein